MKKISSVLIILFSIVSFSQESISHKVRSGETIYAIAKKYDVKEKAIFDVNPNLKGKYLQIGQVITVPKQVKTTETVITLPETYKVEKGDTFYGISKKFNLSINEIQKLNPDLDSRDLKIGMIVQLKKKEEVVEVEQPTITPSENNIENQDVEEDLNAVDVIHVVKKGETLYRIARKYDTSVSKLQELNPNLDKTLPMNYQLVIRKGVQTENVEVVAVKDEEISEVENSSQVTLALADALIVKSSEFLGVRYRSGGTTKAGFDCSGLMCTTFKEIDVNLPRTSRDQANYGIKVKRKQAQKGDLIFFATNRKRTISHVGMITEVNGDEIKFIHSSTSSGVIISSLNEDYYKKRFVQINRVLK